MHDDSPLGQLFLVFAGLSLIAIGGVNSVLPEMHRQVVEIHGWLDSAELARAFAVAQAAPGPNMLVVGLIGWQVAGPLGLLVATAGMCGPSCLLAWTVARARARIAGTRAMRAAQAGLVPVAIGLVLASGVVMARAATTGAIDIVIFAGAGVLATATRLNPLWILALTALAGLIRGLVP